MKLFKSHFAIILMVLISSCNPEEFTTRADNGNIREDLNNYIDSEIRISRGEDLYNNIKNFLFDRGYKEFTVYTDPEYKWFNEKTDSFLRIMRSKAARVEVECEITYSGLFWVDDDMHCMVGVWTYSSGCITSNYQECTMNDWHCESGYGQSGEIWFCDPE